MYDFLIVGAGLTGAVIAHEMTARGKSCLVIDKRDHIAGNIYTRETDGILVHQYGAHIFHTDSPEIERYVRQFSDFNRFTNSPLAFYKGKLYNLPFNMNTFYQLWGTKTPEEAMRKIEQEKAPFADGPKDSLEDYALSLVGREFYETFIKGYTEKQWGRSARELPSSILKRIPLRFTYDNNYFSDNFQGIPVNGYTPIVEKMLRGSEVRLNTAFSPEMLGLAGRTVYTGPIDGFFGYRFGCLEYRGLRFETETLDMPNFQGNAVINYTEREVPWTRIIEHKHFAFGTQPKTVITREYPASWKPGEEPYYPINDEKNSALYEKYLRESPENVIFAGRLGAYRYYDMNVTITEALKLAERLNHGL